MRQIGLLVVVLFSIFLNACTNIVDSNQPTGPESPNQTISTEYTGYITKLEEQSGLIVNSGQLKGSQSDEEFYEAIWISNLPSKLRVGQFVTARIDGMILESYPGQAKAAEVNAVHIAKPEKSNLAQDEVIRKALLNDEISRVNVLVIKEVSYNEQSDVWTMRYKEALVTDGSNEEFSVQIPDIQ